MSGPNNLETMTDNGDFLYVLDFDGTIFDAEKFKEYFFRDLAKQVDATEKKLRDYYEDFKKGVEKFSGDWIDFLIDRLDINREMVIKAVGMILEQRGEELIYGDFKVWFDTEKENLNGSKIIILTAGPEDFQKIKVTEALRAWLGAEWREFFDVAPVCNLNRKTDYLDKIREELEGGKQIVFVDDKIPDGIDELQQVIFVQIRRGTDLSEEIDSYSAINNFGGLRALLSRLTVSGELVRAFRGD